MDVIEDAMQTVASIESIISGNISLPYIEARFGFATAEILIIYVEVII